MAVVLAVCLGTWLGSPIPASAHGILQRTSPPANTSLATPPREIVLLLSEPVDPRLSSVAIFDRDGRRIAGRAAVSSDRLTMSVATGTLAQGVYTVKWRVLSTVDGHTTSGAFAFAVGEAFSRPSGDEVAAGPPRGQVLMRWISLLAAMLLAGSVFFQVFVLTPALAGTDQPMWQRIGRVVLERLAIARLMAGAVLLLTVVAEFGLKAAELFDTPVPQAVASGVLWSLLFSTKLGWSALGRAGTGLAALLPGSPWITSVASAGLLAGFTVASHAAGRGPAAMVADWVHLMAVAVWIGGLGGFLVAMGAVAPVDRPPAVRALIVRISTVAGLALAVVVLTGVYSSWVNVAEVPALTGTMYGRTLLTKLALLLPLVALGAMNRFLLRPRLAGASAEPSAGPARRFMQSVSGEATLGAAMLLVVAVLTLVPPARDTRLPTQQPSVALAGQAGDVGVQLTITPLQGGWHRLEVGVTEADGTPMVEEGRVILSITKLDEKLDPSSVSLAGQGNGLFAAEGGELSQAGPYALEVVVRRRGRADVSTVLPYRVGDAKRRASDPRAAQMLEAARKAMGSLRAWREVEQLADGAGGGIVTRYDVVQPDRLRLRASSGAEVVVIGVTQFQRAGSGPWQRGLLPQPLSALGAVGYTQPAEGVIHPRDARCDDEPCHVLLWEAPGGAASLAGWIGAQSRRIHRLMMVAPSHYMTLRVYDYDAPIKIEPPQ